jgi:hypothetical protein
MTESHLDRNNNNNIMLHLRDTVYATFIHSLRFNEKIFDAFSEVYSSYVKPVLESKNITKDLPELEKIIRSRISNVFNERSREEDFISSKDKSIIEFPSGHVGLIIGQRAHKEVWPKADDWLKYRS